MFAGNFAPKNWALCNGQLIVISQNTALFSILGTMYGGNGTSNFALPNLQGLVPLGAGQGPGLSSRQQGETGGATSVTLTASNLPSHTHSVGSTDAAGNSDDPAGRMWAQAHLGRQQLPMYSSSTGSAPLMHPQALLSAGGGQPHNNMPPYLAVNFIICLFGVFPSRN
jgi:microcystin-dependent protein